MSAEQNPVKTDVTKEIMSGQFTGIVDGLDNEIYHKAPGLSSTGLKFFSETPADYQAYKRTPEKQTDSQLLGQALHLAVLEPELFEKKVVIVDGNRNSHEVKAKLKEAKDQGQVAVKTELYDQVRLMAASVYKHKRANALLSGGVAERSIFWEDPETGILLKCRPDYLKEDEGIVVDLKYFNGLTQREMEAQIYRMKYHWQSQLYLTGVGAVIKKKLNLFVHIFVEEKDPFKVQVGVLNDAALDKAEHDIRELLPRYAECLRTNNWPGYEEEFVNLTLPDRTW